MGHLQIHCDCCGSDWSVYHRDDWKDHKARTCPVCGKSIDSGTWERQVLRAFGEMEDANLELVKDNAQYHGTLFTVGYVPDVIFPNKAQTEELNQLREDISDLTDSLDNLKNIVTKLIDGVFHV